MGHALKSDFFFRQNGRVHLNRRGASIQSTTGSRVVHISGSYVGFTMFQVVWKFLASLFSLSFPLPSVTECRHIWNLL